MAWAGRLGCVRTFGVTEKESCPTHLVTSSVRASLAAGLPAQPLPHVPGRRLHGPLLDVAPVWWAGFQ